MRQLEMDPGNRMDAVLRKKQSERKCFALAELVTRPQAEFKSARSYGKGRSARCQLVDHPFSRLDQPRRHDCKTHKRLERRARSTALGHIVIKNAKFLLYWEIWKTTARPLIETMPINHFIGATTHPTQLAAVDFVVPPP